MSEPFDLDAYYRGRLNEKDEAIATLHRSRDSWIAEVERLRAAMNGWDAYGWKDGVYVDSLDAYFKAVIAGETPEKKP